MCASSGRTTKHILEKAQLMINDLTMEDSVVVIAGANDIPDLSSECNIPVLFQKFALDNKHTNIVFVTQFYRYDLSRNNSANNNIEKINKELHKLTELNLIGVSGFRRHFFGRQVQHLNKLGKQALCRRIADVVLNNRQAKKKAGFEVDTTLEIIEADMHSIFDKYCNSPEVAFGHCISADFENKEKHMSQGVAVAFGNRFGKPNKSDYCNKNLTYQKTKLGAAVYSLVTKPQYFLHANNFDKYKDTYDMAFSQLTKDFKARGLKTLFFSPMGCIGDRISPPHFVKNLLNFKEETGA